MKNKKTADGLLVFQYQSGDLKALPDLVKRWHKTFCEKAFWLIKDADVAKDIAQDSWKTIIDKLHGLKNPHSFGSWGLKIVYTKSLDWINTSNRTRKKLEAYSHEQNITSFDDERKFEPLRKALFKAITSLPEKQRITIRLFYVEEYSLKEIGEFLNVSTGTAKSRLFYAREKLKSILKHKNYENQ